MERSALVLLEAPKEKGEPPEEEPPPNKDAVLHRQWCVY